MIHRLVRGQIPKKPHTVFEVDGALTFEHCITRAGFESIYTIAWHRKPPHWIAVRRGPRASTPVGPRPLGGAAAALPLPDDGSARRRDPPFSAAS